MTRSPRAAFLALTALLPAAATAAAKPAPEVDAQRTVFHQTPTERANPGLSGTVRNEGGTHCVDPVLVVEAWANGPVRIPLGATLRSGETRKVAGKKIERPVLVDGAMQYRVRCSRLEADDARSERPAAAISGESGADQVRRFVAANKVTTTSGKALEVKPQAAADRSDLPEITEYRFVRSRATPLSEGLFGRVENTSSFHCLDAVLVVSTDHGKIAKALGGTLRAGGKMELVASEIVNAQFAGPRLVSELRCRKLEKSADEAAPAAAPPADADTRKTLLEVVDLRTTELGGDTRVSGKVRNGGADRCRGPVGEIVLLVGTSRAASATMTLPSEIAPGEVADFSVLLRTIRSARVVPEVSCRAVIHREKLSPTEILRRKQGGS